MPWSGSGNFTRVHDWTDDRDAAVKILASRHDTEDDNFQAGIQACLAKNGENSATANLPMGGFAHTGVANGTARTQYGAIAQIQDGALHYAVASGTDTYTASLSPAITAYTNGLPAVIKFTNANTGAATLNLNSVGAIAIRKFHDQALIAGDIEANSIVELRYNSTIPCFEIIGPLGGAGTLNDPGANGIVVRTAAHVTTGRTLTAGSGIAVTNGDGTGGNPTVALDIAGLANETAPAVDDTFPMRDTSEGANNEMRFDDYLKVINGLTEDTTPDSTADYTVTYDASGAVAKKVLLDTAASLHDRLGTEQATTSGTSWEFTSIPSWVKKIIVSVDGFSTNGTSGMRLRIGPSGGVETTGYNGGRWNFSNAAAVGVTANSAGFDGSGATSAARLEYGQWILALEDSTNNVWSCTWQFYQDDTTDTMHGGAGTKALAGTLSRLMLTTQNGTDTGDAGAVNIEYSG